MFQVIMASGRILAQVESKEHAEMVAANYRSDAFIKAVDLERMRVVARLGETNDPDELAAINKKQLELSDLASRLFSGDAFVRERA